MEKSDNKNNSWWKPYQAMAVQELRWLVYDFVGILPWELLSVLDADKAAAAAEADVKKDAKEAEPETEPRLSVAWRTARNNVWPCRALAADNGHWYVTEDLDQELVPEPYNIRFTSRRQICWHSLAQMVMAEYDDLISYTTARSHCSQILPALAEALWKGNDTLHMFSAYTRVLAAMDPEELPPAHEQKGTTHRSPLFKTQLAGKATLRSDSNLYEGQLSLQQTTKNWLLHSLDAKEWWRHHADRDDEDWRHSASPLQPDELHDKMQAERGKRREITDLREKHLLAAPVLPPPVEESRPLSCKRYDPEELFRRAYPHHWTSLPPLESKEIDANFAAEDLHQLLAPKDFYSLLTAQDAGSLYLGEVSYCTLADPAYLPTTLQEAVMRAQNKVDFHRDCPDCSHLSSDNSDSDSECIDIFTDVHTADTACTLEEIEEANRTLPEYYQLLCDK